MTNDWLRLYRGIDLRVERELRGISLERFSDETRYSIRQLQDFEAGCFDKMPNEVFLRGLIKTYIQKLGLDPEMVKLEFLFQQRKNPIKIQDNSVKGGLINSLKDAQIGPVGLFFLISVLLVFFLWPQKEQEILVFRDQNRGKGTIESLSRKEAISQLEMWVHDGVTLMKESTLNEDIPVIHIEGGDLTIVSQASSWIRIQNMVSGIDSLSALFPGETRKINIREETIMWIEKPNAISIHETLPGTSIDFDSNDIIRFLPMESHYIMSEDV